MKHKRIGILLVVCAPSGAGKSTLLTRLRDEFPSIVYSISATTRAPRKGEVDGRDYHFLTRPRFEELRDQGYFAEWAVVHGNLYGTPKAPVLEALWDGRDVLFDIDVDGAAQLRHNFEKGAYVFILPPSREELQRRLRGRGTDSPETVALRLDNALGELRAAPEFDYWVVNDVLDEAYADLRAIYLAEGNRPERRPGLLEDILDGFEQGA